MVWYRLVFWVYWIVYICDFLSFFILRNIKSYFVQRLNVVNKVLFQDLFFQEFWSTLVVEHELESNWLGIRDWFAWSSVWRYSPDDFKLNTRRLCLKSFTWSIACPVSIVVNVERKWWGFKTDALIASLTPWHYTLL